MGELQSQDSEMTIWGTTPETTPKKTAPCEALVTFVAKNYKPPARFLDIGSGSGANSWYLEDSGFQVASIDIWPESKGAAVHAIGDVREIYKWAAEQFDCIFDIETLQHVEDVGPVYEAIYRALKPGGKFFSIHIADDSKINVTGKGYTRLADVLTMRRLLGRGFMRFTVHKTTNWNGDTKATAWQIEAEK